MRIEIVSWEKFNPRKDLKNMAWMRVSSSIGIDPKLFGLDAGQKWLWIFLLSTAAQDNKSILELEVDYLAHYVGIPIAKVIEALDQFQKKGLVKLLTNESVTNPIASQELPERTRNESVTNPIGQLESTIGQSMGSGSNINDTCLTDGRTERTNGTNGTNTTDETDTTNGTPTEAKAEAEDVKALARLWNELRSDKQPEVRVSALRPNTPRYQSAKARLSEEPDLGYWKGVIERIAASSFCNGKNDRSWVADFEFLTRLETHVKAGEGKYDDKQASSSSIGLTPDREADLVAGWIELTRSHEVARGQ